MVDSALIAPCSRVFCGARAHLGYSLQTMTRSRALHKLLCDFQEAATAGALAIADVSYDCCRDKIEVVVLMEAFFCRGWIGL